MEENPSVVPIPDVSGQTTYAPTELDTSTAVPIEPVRDQMSPAPAGEDDLFRLTYRLIEDIQRVRLSHGNRVRQVLPLIPAHVSPPRGTPTWEVFFKASAEVLESEEARLLKLAKKLLHDDPIGRWLLSQKGIGPALGVSILGECWPLTKFASPRKLWAFSGLHVIEGVAAKRRKGVKANWNARLKTRLWLFSQSILKAGGPWRELYDARKVLEYAKAGAQLPHDGQEELAPRPEDSGGAQPCTDGQVTYAPSGSDHAGAQDTHDSHEHFAPGTESPGVAHATSVGQSRSARSGRGRKKRGGAQEGVDSYPCPAPAASYSDLPATADAGSAHGSSDDHIRVAPPGFTKLHLHNRALRYTQKALLLDLWRVAHGEAPLITGAPPESPTVEMTANEGARAPGLPIADVPAARRVSAPEPRP